MNTTENIEVTEPLLKPDCILIDDDELVQFSWRLSAKSVSRSFVGFTKTEDFFVKFHQFDRSTPVFVDCNLGNGVSGEEVAKKIHDSGFCTIYISTWYAGRNFAHLTFLKGVVGKDPVWLSGRPCLST
jgi:hypothetical protein